MRSPLASGVERLFATRSLHPLSSFRRCSFARPSASSITATSCVSTFVDLQPALVRSELSASSRVRTILRLPFSDGTAGPNRCFKHPPSCEAFSFETQARAIQDISRSRASEFTPLENRRKGNHKYFCDYPVQNLSVLWSRVDKEDLRGKTHNMLCRIFLIDHSIARISVQFPQSIDRPAHPSATFVPGLAIWQPPRR